MPNSNLKYLPLVAFLFLSLSYLEGTQATKLVLPGVTKVYPTTEPTTTTKVAKTNRPWEVTKGYLNPTTTTKNEKTTRLWPGTKNYLTTSPTP